MTKQQITEYHRINNDVEKYIEGLTSDQDVMEEILERIELLDPDTMYSIKINPKIRMYGNLYNLRFTNEDYYKEFVKKMAKLGINVITNIDDYKLTRLDILSKVTDKENQYSKTGAPDFDRISFSKSSSKQTFSNKLRDTLYNKTIQKELNKRMRD